MGTGDLGTLGPWDFVTLGDLDLWNHLWKEEGVGFMMVGFLFDYSLTSLMNLFGSGGTLRSTLSLTHSLTHSVG